MSTVLRGIARQKNLFAWSEKTRKPRPIVGENRRATGRRFEEPHGGRVPGLHHVGACEIEREARRRVEAGMIRRRNVREPPYVLVPGHVLRIHRPSDEELVIGQHLRAAIQQVEQLGLAIGCVGA